MDTMNLHVAIERTELLSRSVTGMTTTERDKDIALVWISELTADLLRNRKKSEETAFKN